MVATVEEMVAWFKEIDPHGLRLLASRPMQEAGMSVQAYYDEFCVWKNKLDGLNYPADEESYIDDFNRWLKWDLHLRVFKYPSKPRSLKVAYDRAKFEETMTIIEGLNMKIGVDKVLEEIPKHILVHDLNDQSAGYVSYDDSGDVLGVPHLVDDEKLPDAFYRALSEENDNIEEDKNGELANVENDSPGSGKVEELKVFDEIPNPDSVIKNENQGVGGVLDRDDTNALGDPDFEGGDFRFIQLLEKPLLLLFEDHVTTKPKCSIDENEGAADVRNNTKENIGYVVYELNVMNFQQKKSGQKFIPYLFYTNGTNDSKEEYAPLIVESTIVLFIINGKYAAVLPSCDKVVVFLFDPGGSFYTLINWSEGTHLSSNWGRLFDGHDVNALYLPQKAFDEKLDPGLSCDYERELVFSHIGLYLNIEGDSNIKIVTMAALPNLGQPSAWNNLPSSSKYASKICYNGRRLARELHNIVIKNMCILNNYVEKALIKINVKYCCLNDEKMTLIHMINMDNVIWDSSVSACAKNEMVNHMFNLFMIIGLPYLSQSEPIYLILGPLHWLCFYVAFSNRIDHARTENGCIDSLTFSTLIKMHGMAANFDGCLSLYEEMKTVVDVWPNMIVYNNLFDAMGRAKRPWLAQLIYKDLLKSDFEPIQGTYAVIIRAFGRARYDEDVLIVYREMKQKEIELTAVLYNTLLSMCADLRLTDEAAEIFVDSKRSENCRPDRWSYSSMVTLFSCGKVSDAGSALSDMLEEGYVSNRKVVTKLVTEGGEHYKIDIFSTKRAIMKKNVILQGYTFAFLMILGMDSFGSISSQPVNDTINIDIEDVIPNRVTPWLVLQLPSKENLLDCKKFQNIVILLKALHVSEYETCGTNYVADKLDNFIWDPGITMCYFHILEDKDVVKGRVMSGTRPGVTSLQRLYDVNWYLKIY